MRRAQGDFTPLAEFALLAAERSSRAGNPGCISRSPAAEDLPWIKPGEGERAARDFPRRLRLKQQPGPASSATRVDLPG